MLTSLSTFLTEYADQTPADDGGPESVELVIPEDLTALSRDDLDALHGQAVDTFEAVYGDGTVELSEDMVTALAELTESITSLRAEQTARDEQAAERAGRAAELAAQIRPTTTDTDSDSDGDSDGGDDAGETAEAADTEGQLVAAGTGRREVRVNLTGLRGRQLATPEPAGPRSRT